MSNLWAGALKFLVVILFWNDGLRKNACRMATLERAKLDYVDYSSQGNEWQENSSLPY